MESRPGWKEAADEDPDEPGRGRIRGAGRRGAGSGTDEPVRDAGGGRGAAARSRNGCPAADQPLRVSLAAGLRLSAADARIARPGAACLPAGLLSVSRAGPGAGLLCAAAPPHLRTALRP